MESGSSNAKQEKSRRQKEEASPLKSPLHPEDDEFAKNYGNVTFVEMQSIAVDNRGAGNWRTAIEGKNINDFKELDNMDDESEVLVRGRVHEKRAMSNTIVFLVLRQRGLTMQCVAKCSEETKVGKQLIRFVKNLPLESVIDIFGVKTKADKPLESTTQKVEVQIRKIYCLSRPSTPLPFEIRNASAPESDSKAVPVHQDTRLKNRVLDLRTLANQAIFRLVCHTETAIRHFLVSKGFTGIHTPRLIKGAVEGGANVFKLKYHGDDACLAQSAQLHKQMAVCGGLTRVFDIGPFFRAENSNTTRHLCEFVAVHAEMEIRNHFWEIMDLVNDLLLNLFKTLNENCVEDLDAIGRQYPFKPLKLLEETLRLSWEEAVQMLKEAGEEINPLADLSRDSEKMLGNLVRKKYETDFYMLYGFPSAARPIFTMPDPCRDGYSLSFDVYIRGEEIISGAQRLHIPDQLEVKAKERGINVETISSYIDSFRFGAPPHGGFGMGLERVVMLFCGLDNIRKTSLFPRDPKRLAP